MNRQGMQAILTAILFGIAAVVAPVQAAEKADVCFDRLPPGWTIIRSFVAAQDQTAAIAKRLGAPIGKLSNTLLSVHGQQVQVNILESRNDAGATKLHAAVSRMKGDPAFCVRKGRKVFEYTGTTTTVALATKVSYELGFVPKPREVRYRVVADVATVDVADYMSSNKLFNLFLKKAHDPGDTRIPAQIAELSGRFRFGNRITLRRPGEGKRSTVYRFAQPPVKKEATKQNDTVTFAFDNTSRSLGVPYVTLTADITTGGTGITPDRRKADKRLLAATEFWPAEDPQIVALAGEITAGNRTREARVAAILRWLTPGSNIKFGGPVTGSRWGVKKVLQNKYGRCWDFSDCFVTFCRASGIPSRQVAGWLYGASGHIWAEVFVDGKGWRQVDPTGGGKLSCGIYHIPYFTTEDGDMPILYVSMPRIEIRSAR